MRPFPCLVSNLIPAPATPPRYWRPLPCFRPCPLVSVAGVAVLPCLLAGVTIYAPRWHVARWRCRRWCPRPSLCWCRCAGKIGRAPLLVTPVFSSNYSRYFPRQSQRDKIPPHGRAVCFPRLAAFRWCRCFVAVAFRWLTLRPWGVSIYAASGRPSLSACTF